MEGVASARMFDVNAYTSAQLQSFATTDMEEESIKQQEIMALAMTIEKIKYNPNGSLNDSGMKLLEGIKKQLEAEETGFFSNAEKFADDVQTNKMVKLYRILTEESDADLKNQTGMLGEPLPISLVLGKDTKDVEKDPKGENVINEAVRKYLKGNSRVRKALHKAAEDNKNNHMVKAMNSIHEQRKLALEDNYKEVARLEIEIKLLFNKSIAGLKHLIGKTYGQLTNDKRKLEGKIKDIKRAKFMVGALNKKLESSDLSEKEKADLKKELTKFEEYLALSYDQKTKEIKTAITNLAAIDKQIEEIEANNPILFEAYANTQKQLDTAKLNVQTKFTEAQFYEFEAHVSTGAYKQVVQVTQAGLMERLPISLQLQAIGEVTGFFVAHGYEDEREDPIQETLRAKYSNRAVMFLDNIKKELEARRKEMELTKFPTTFKNVNSGEEISGQRYEEIAKGNQELFGLKGDKIPQKVRKAKVEAELNQIKNTLMKDHNIPEDSVSAQEIFFKESGLEELEAALLSEETNSFDQLEKHITEFNRREGRFTIKDNRIDHLKNYFYQKDTKGRLFIDENQKRFLAKETMEHYNIKKGKIEEELLSIYTGVLKFAKSLPSEVLTTSISG